MAGLTFEESPLWTEAETIFHTAKPLQLYDYSGTVHIGPDGGDFELWDLNTKEVVRDYVHHLFETLYVTFKIGAGDYINRLYPYRSNLEFTLKKIPIQNGERQLDDEIIIERYKAIFDTSKNPPAGMSELEHYNTEDLNISGVVEVMLELVDRGAEVFRIKTFGDAWQNQTVGNQITSVLGSEFSKIEVDGRRPFDGIDIVSPDNQTPIRQMSIPHGSRVVAFPTRLQEEYGVYNAGLGMFFQRYKERKTWFVYPLYATERFDQITEKVIFYGIPQEKMPQADRTWVDEGGLIKIAITAQRKFADHAEVNLMNEGSGFRMPDANAFMKKPVVLGSQGPEGARTRLNHEVIMKERLDGLNYAPVTFKPSANPYRARSEVRSRYVGQLDMVWENANPDLIYPGMPCKFLYLNQGKVISIKGVILLVQALAVKLEKLRASPFRENCRITIACDPDIPLPDLPLAQTPTDDMWV